MKLSELGEHARGTFRGRLKTSPSVTEKDAPSTTMFGFSKAFVRPRASIILLIFLRE